MNSMTLEKIKNVLFNEIDLSFANDKLIIKLDKENEIKNKFPTIEVYSKNLEEMADKELFTFLTELYLQTGNIIHFSKIKDYTIGKELLLRDKYMFINESGKELYIDKDSVVLDEEFLKKINISAFNGITEKIDEALNKEENVIFNVLLSDKTSINSYENRFGLSYFLFLEDNMLGKAIYNYLLNGVFEKDLTTSMIKFDNSKNSCRIDENNLKVIINSKTLVNELYETGLLEQEYEKEKNMKRQLKWEE